jgi:ABC-type Fe3+/spermidine/putrescine transport system ATPase subunit
MISIRHISKSFGKNAAIDDFSLEIAAGEHRTIGDLSNYLNPN